MLNAAKEPHNWLSYSGTLDNQRYSLLTQITPANVKNLQLQWIWQAKSLEKFEATPLVVDGVMYTVEAPNNVVALDAATGRPFWPFNYTPAPEGRALLRPGEPRRRDSRRHALHGHASTRTSSPSTPRAASSSGTPSVADAKDRYSSPCRRTWSRTR